MIRKDKYMSPCYSCKNPKCKHCENRVYGNPNFAITDHIVEDLWREVTDIAFVENSDSEMVLDQPWRGFPVGEFSQDDLFLWVDEHHSKGVGFVYENI